MASPNREQLLQMAVQSAKQGNKQGAKVMLRQILDEDPRNERAMMWMAKISTAPTERKQWLERVLQVNPENEVAQQALEKLSYDKSASENRKLFFFGGVAAVALMLIIILGTAWWAFAPLS